MSGALQAGLREGSVKEAKAWLTSQMQAHPSDAKLLFEYHFLCLATKDYPTAVSLLVKLLEITSSDGNKDTEARTTLFCWTLKLLLPQIVASGHIEFLPADPIPQLPLPVDDLFSFLKDQGLKERLLLSCRDYFAASSQLEEAAAIQHYLLEVFPDKQHSWCTVARFMLQYLCKQHGLQSDSFDSWQDPSLLPLFRTLSKRSLSPHIIFTVERCVPNLLAELSSEGTEPVKEDREYFSKQRVETSIVFSAYYHIRSGSYKSIYEMLRFLLPPLPFQTLPATLFQWSSVLFSLSSSPLPEETMEHLFLPLVIILFHAAWDYAGFLFQLGGRTEGAGRETGGQQATNLTDGSMLVMLRDPSQELQQQALSANRKVLRHESLVSVQHNLRIILECLLRLRHPGVASRFQSLCECWNVSRWVWFQFSVADAFLYSRNYQDGARIYETLLSKSYREIWEQTSISCSDLSFIFDGRAASQRRQGELYSLRLRLQRGCCLFHAGAIEEAKRSLLEILVELPPQGRTTSRQGPHTPNKKRKFMPEVWSSPLSSENHSDSSLGIYFWPLCEKNLFYHSLELLIHSYKASGQLEAVLVLMQFEWPYYQQACQTVIRAIHKEQEQRGLGGFRWNMGPYLPFLVNMDILEELVAMCLRSEMRDRGAQHHPHPHSPTEAFQSRQQLERHIVAISDEHVDPEAAVLACLARFFQQALRAALISGEPEPHQQPQQPQLPQRPAPPRHSQLQQQLQPQPQPQPQPMQQQGSHARRSDAASPSSSSF